MLSGHDHKFHEDEEDFEWPEACVADVDEDGNDVEPLCTETCQESCEDDCTDCLGFGCDEDLCGEECTDLTGECADCAWCVWAELDDCFDSCVYSDEETGEDVNCYVDCLECADCEGLDDDEDCGCDENQ